MSSRERWTGKWLPLSVFIFSSGVYQQRHLGRGRLAHGLARYAAQYLILNPASHDDSGTLAHMSRQQRQYMICHPVCREWQGHRRVSVDRRVAFPKPDAACPDDDAARGKPCTGQPSSGSTEPDSPQDPSFARVGAHLPWPSLAVKAPAVLQSLARTSSSPFTGTTSSSEGGGGPAGCSMSRIRRARILLLGSFCASAM